MSEDPLNGTTSKEYIIDLISQCDRRHCVVMDEREKRYLDKFAAKEELALVVESASARAVGAAAAGVAELRDRVNEAVPRAEWALQHKVLNDKMDELKADIAVVRTGQSAVAGTRAGMGMIVAYIIGSLGFVAAILSIILRAFGI